MFVNIMSTHGTTRRPKPVSNQSVTLMTKMNTCLKSFSDKLQASWYFLLYGTCRVQQGAGGLIRAAGLGLANAPATFQPMMNIILRPYLEKFCKAHFDDILIFSRTFNDYVKNVEKALETIQRNQLYAQPSKCEIGVRCLEFCGHVI